MQQSAVDLGEFIWTKCNSALLESSIEVWPVTQVRCTVRYGHGLVVQLYFLDVYKNGVTVIRNPL